MTSLPTQQHKHSDKNCLSSCRLLYGLSEVFEQIVQEQQNVKASKSHINPQTFTDPNDQKTYQHMLDDVMIKTFDSPEEQVVFRAALEGMKGNYSEILKGTEQNMFYAPTAFNFDSRIGETSCVPDALDQLQSSLESNVNLTLKELKNLKKIRLHLQNLKPQMAEQQFVDALACFFYQKRGIFIHSLKLDQHLKTLTDKARHHRKQNTKIGFGFTDLENKLKKQFNISDQHLTDKSDMIAIQLSGQHQANAGQPIKGRVVRSVIENEFKDNERLYTMKLFKSGNDYTLNEIKEGIQLGIFESECHVAGENDLFIMIPDSKLILCVEVKQHMTCKTGPKIDHQMRSATSQLKKNARFFSSMHGAILSPGWQFAKICAISPTLYNSEKICENCKRFILTTDILKTPGGLAKWWNETGLADRCKTFGQKAKDEAYREFQRFFYRLICLSSVRVVPDPFHTWAQIQGRDDHHMTAGHTEATADEIAMATSGDVDVETILKSSHSAFKTLFFNKDQQALLTTDKYPYAVFLCDFGAGK